MCRHIQHLCNISQIQYAISPKPIKTESSEFIKIWQQNSKNLNILGQNLKDLSNTIITLNKLTKFITKWHQTD